MLTKYENNFDTLKKNDIVKNDFSNTNWIGKSAQLIANELTVYLEKQV